MLRSVILAASRSSRFERFVETAPVSRDVVRRFVAGSTDGDALRASQHLTTHGIAVSLDFLGEDAQVAEPAAGTRDQYIGLLRALSDAGLTRPIMPEGPVHGPAHHAGQDGVDEHVRAPSTPAPAVEVSVKLSALGQLFDEQLAFDHARTICAAAAEAGTTVTLDMEDSSTTDSTLEILGKLRKDYPSTGVALQAYLRRTEADCRELAVAGVRVRLCKGAYSEPESVAYQAAVDVDKSYVRCMNILLSGSGYPMLATHDPRLVAIAEDRARWFDRSPGGFEFQMLYGIRPDEQRRLAASGYTMRVYVPYGTRWYGYLMRRLAERPANVRFFLRALRSKA